MKFFIDVCISSKLVSALQALEGERLALEHLTHRFGTDTDDLVWLSALAAEGGWTLLTQDGRITRNPEQKAALATSGMPAYFFSSKFAEAKFWPKVEETVRWWPHLTLHARNVAAGSWWSLPWGEKRPTPRR